MGESAPFWRFSAASYPDLEGTLPVDTHVGARKTTDFGESDASVGVIICLSLLWLCMFFCSFLRLFPICRKYQETKI